MSKHRIFELAKEFETTSKTILDLLERNNHPVRNHMSMVDDEERAIVVRYFNRKNNPVYLYDKNRHEKSH